MFASQLHSHASVTGLRVAWCRQDDLLWRVPVHAESGDAVVVGYSETESSYVTHRIDERTGESRWTRTLPVGGYGAPAIIGERVAVLTDHVGLALLDWSDGRRVAERRMNARIRSPIAVSDDGFVFSSARRLLGVGLDGEIREIAGTSEHALFGLPLETRGAWHSLYVRQSRPGVGVVGVTRLGANGWATDLAESFVASSDTSGIAESRDGRILAGAGRTVAAIDPGTGRVIWQVHRPGITTRSVPVEGEGCVVVADTSGTVASLDIDDGTLLWEVRVCTDGIWSPPSLTAQTVIVIGGGLLHILDLATGAVRATSPIGHSPYSAVTFAADGRAMVGGGDPPYHGLLVGFEPADEMLPAYVRAVGPDRWRIDVGAAGDGDAVQVDVGVFGAGMVSRDDSGEFQFGTGRMDSGTYALRVTLDDGRVILAGLDLGPASELPVTASVDRRTFKAVSPLHSGAAILAAVLGGEESDQALIRDEAERVIELSERQPWDLWRLAARQVLHDPPQLRAGTRPKT